MKVVIRIPRNLKDAALKRVPIDTGMLRGRIAAEPGVKGHIGTKNCYLLFRMPLTNQRHRKPPNTE